MTRLTPYQLACHYRELATERCASWEEDDRRQRALASIEAEMDARGIQLEDWESQYHR